MSQHIYPDKYYDYIGQGSLSSADVVLGQILNFMSVESVLDVGCGRGAWLCQWAAAGVTDFTGVDGDYIKVEKLPFSASHFVSANLAVPLDLNRTFDLVQSLEVAEHLHESAADDFVDSLVRHGDVVMFSAATPGQGGEHHVNEQPLEYWRAKFAGHGYQALDLIRPNIDGDRRVQPWYRFNILVYANSAGLKRLNKGAVVQESVGLENFAPLSWRARNRLISFLPYGAMMFLVRQKHIVTRLASRFYKRPS